MLKIIANSVCWLVRKNKLCNEQYRFPIVIRWFWSHRSRFKLFPSNLHNILTSHLVWKRQFMVLWSGIWGMFSSSIFPNQRLHHFHYISIRKVLFWSPMRLSHISFFVFNETTKQKFNFISIYEDEKVFPTKPFIKLTFHLSMMIPTEHIEERERKWETSGNESFEVQNHHHSSSANRHLSFYDIE